MSAITLARHSLRRAVQLQSVSSVRYASTMHDNDPQVLEREKHRNLTGTQHHTSTPHRHAPGWNEALASESEAHVKADQSTLSPDELQKTTVDYVKKRHPADVVEEAKYVKDEIEGPLRSAVSAIMEKTGLKDSDKKSN